MGIAFSIGFVVGPMIGAFFAWISSGNREGTWYMIPAMFAFFLALSDFLFVFYYLKESLPLKNRATTLAKGLSGAISYINPVDLFQFNGVSSLSQHGIQIFGLSNKYHGNEDFDNICVNSHFRSTRFKNIGPCIFYILVYLQWLRIHFDIFNSSYVRIYEYATGLDVSRDRFDHGDFAGQLGATHPAKQNKSN